METFVVTTILLRDKDMFFDFVEVGTSDFNTLIQKVDDNTVGLSIDPIELYLNNFVNNGSNLTPLAQKTTFEN